VDEGDADLFLELTATAAEEEEVFSVKYYLVGSYVGEDGALVERRAAEESQEGGGVVER